MSGIFPLHDAASSHAPSLALLSGALAGLLGVGLTPACSRQRGVAAGEGADAGVFQEPREAGVSGAGGRPADAGTPDSGGSSLSFSNLVSTTPISFGAFSGLCEERGGFVTTNAHCAGSNLCKGLSYMEDGSTLTEHSCRGMNSCTGFSCVDLPVDSGLSGKELYETGPCTGCHNDAQPGEPARYAVFVRPGTSVKAALAAFTRSSTARLQSIVAFGTQGLNDDGTTYSNMPAYRDTYSRAEIQRVVEYLRTLPTYASVYEIPGQPPLDAGVPGMPMPDGGGGGPP